LSYHKELQVRENRFRELKDQICALALKNDEVVPPNEVKNTLNGEERDIPIHVDVKDFPYKYDHVMPFSASSALELEVDAAFNEVFNIAAQFLK
ncbi:MAG: DUF6051 family protein, partial [Bacteroidota bacterium]|nr:DUF6051 family protein [Bacteroidota bacterium]